MKVLYCSAGKLCLYICYLIFFYLLLCAWRPARGQTPYTIQGRILSAENQQPLVGTNVMLKGTTNGTSTDRNGYFTLSTTENKVALVASFIGYRSLDTLLQLPLKRELVLLLQQDLTMLEEVKVSTGYWQSSKRLSTGNISKVTAEAIEKQPVTNVMQALQGRMPGVYVSQQSGVPGSGIDIQIRGRNSLRSAGNAPLYIIDGVPFPSASIASGMGGTVVSALSPMNTINPSDIESIEVLKDADATAIYGSRGSNGVVLITTKKGVAGKTSVTMDFYSGAGKLTRVMDLLNTSQYVSMRREAFENDNAEITGSSAPDLVLWDTTRYTNWQKEMIGGTARKTSANVAISGGNQNTTMLLRGGYLRETSVFPGSFAYQRGSAYASVSHGSDNKKFQIKLSSSFTSDNNKLPSADLITQGIQLPPNAPAIYQPDGSLNWEDGTWTNPYAAILKTYVSKTANLTANSVVSYQVSSALSLRVSLGYNWLVTTENRKEPLGSFNPSQSPTGRNRFGNSSLKTWVAEPQVQYQKRVRRAFIDVLAGMTFQNSLQEGQYLYGTGYTSDALLDDVRSAPTLTVVSANYTAYRYAGAYGRMNVILDEKYIVNLTARRDGSSRFGPSKQFANFGALGMAWIFSSEKFFPKTDWLSSSKLRASYGTSGSDQIPDYGFMDSYSSVAPYQGSSIVPTRIANPYYSWEVNKKMEVGLDLGLFNERLRMGASWYRSRSSNQLVGEPLPFLTGFASVQNNFAATVQNSGIEVEFSAEPIERNGFSWTTSLNVTVPQNKLLAYPGIETSSYRDTYEVGKSIFTTKKYHYLGVDPSTGIYQFADIDQDGSWAGAADKQALKKVGQLYYGAVQNTITYKKLSLSIFLQGVKQNSRSYMYSSAFGQTPGRMSNQPHIVMQRWRQPADRTDIQKFTQSLTSDARIAFRESQAAGDNTVTDGSFIRLQNLSLAWDLPMSWMRKIHVQGLRWSVQAQNLITLTKYIGYDPETGTASSIPPLKYVTTGFQLTL